MKKQLIIILCAALLMMCAACAHTEEQPPLLADDGWSYIGYTYGGVTFAVPRDYMSAGISAADAARGYIIMGGNRDFSIQLRVFQPYQLTYDEFKAMIGQVGTAETHTRMDGSMEILTYRNTAPNAYSELYGIAMTGLDGLFYKISIFTGDDGAYSPDAPVWEIAEVIAQSACHRDFSEWGITDATDASEDNWMDQLSDFLDSLIGK